MTETLLGCSAASQLMGQAVLIVRHDGGVVQADGFDGVEIPDWIDAVDTIRRMGRSSGASPGRLTIDGTDFLAHGMRLPESQGDVIIRLTPAGSSNFVQLNERIASLQASEAETRAALQRAISAEADAVALVSALQESNTQLEHFAGLVAHDIRAPIRTARILAQAIIGTTDDVNDPEMTVDLGGRLVDTLGRLDSIVLRLLEYSSLNDETLKPETVECDELAAEVVGDLSAGLDKAGIVPELHTTGSVCADRALLVVALRELVLNAAKHRVPSRHARIRIEFQGDAEPATLVISDNGSGIPEESRARAFDMFTRLRSDGPDGLGFGLSYCRRIVEVHGGTIELDTGLDGGGTSVRIELPGNGV